MNDAVTPVLDIHVQTTLESPGRSFVLDARFVSTTSRTALIGASGSGKSTVLMAIAGLAPHARGHVRVAGKTLLDTANAIDLPARERRVGLVFQDYALFPHMTVEQNVAFGLCRIGQRPSEAERARIDALARQFDLETLRGALPRHLSGGQRQRVALARALAPQPHLLLLDEPLSALDTQLRVRLRTELAEMLERVQIPTLLVTHDPSDVEALAQSVVHLDAGCVSPLPPPPVAARSVD
jgi:molybdate transport system ATP-binding protein